MDPAAVTLVCFAVKEEARWFNRLAGERPHVRVLITGMGRRNAEEAVRTALAKERPGLVLSCGFAGGLDPELPGGTVVYAVESQPAMEAALQKAGARRVRFHCAERVAATAVDKKALRKATGAEAVEMESRVISAVCAEYDIPTATVRVILDAAGEDLPLDFNSLMTEDQRMDNCKLALALARSPGKIAALLRLQKQSEAAARRLGEVLERIVQG
jgi:nucleoside phosphorylase